MLAFNEDELHQDAYVLSDNPVVFADIYQPQVKLINWQRELSAEVKRDIAQLLEDRHKATFRMILRPEQVSEWLQETWGKDKYTALADDVEMLVTLYADLLEASQVGLRLELIDKTMCPLFHVDKVLCRLVSTYHGAGTEWLTANNTNWPAFKMRQHEQVVIDDKQVRSAAEGEVLLFKGESWSDDEGVVHRSADASVENRRLVLTLDLV